MDQPTLTQELEMIELSIEQAKAKVELASALRRLCKNRDFKKVFLDHYLGTEVVRTVKLMAEPSFRGQPQQELLGKMLISAGQLDQFMRSTLTIGDMAQESINEDEAVREQILLEDEAA